MVYVPKNLVNTVSFVSSMNLKEIILQHNKDKPTHDFQTKLYFICIKDKIVWFTEYRHVHWIPFYLLNYMNLRNLKKNNLQS